MGDETDWDITLLHQRYHHLHDFGHSHMASQSLLIICQLLHRDPVPLAIPLSPLYPISPAVLSLVVRGLQLDSEIVDIEVALEPAFLEELAMFLREHVMTGSTRGSYAG